ncbi:MAG TPA: pyridoxal phosphate-dependent aminotransferase [Streptosporangiaceae bacterium]|nr:pyridoxal phosphate-dependent aminotransferase [Streptosporangiaceae bacterium]
MPTELSVVGDRAATIPASATASLDGRLKDLAASGTDVINLTSGEVDFPTLPSACAAGVDAIASGFTRYTAVAGTTELRSAVSAWLSARHGTSYPPEQIVVANGAKQALSAAFMAMLNPGDEVLLPAPYWVSFPHMITLAGGTARAVTGSPDTGFKVTPEAMRAHTTARTRALVLNNPVNPTGAVYSRAELEAIADTAERLDLTVVSDEIYAELVYPPATFTSFASLSDDAMHRTVTINGVSKTFAMTGWRIGYAAAQPPVVKAMTAIQSHCSSAPSSISQRAALGALTSSDSVSELQRRRADLDRRRRVMIDGLTGLPGIGVPFEPTGAFFLLADVTGCFGRRHGGTLIGDAAAFAQALLDSELVGVVPGDSFGAPGYVRASYVVPEAQLADAIDRLRRFTGALHGQGSDSR